MDSVALKDIFDEHDIERCHFLKLDCEGAEYELLYNLPGEYYSRIERIVMEYHGDNDKMKRRAQADALVSHLQSMGFGIDAYLDLPVKSFAASRSGFSMSLFSASGELGCESYTEARIDSETFITMHSL